MKKVKINKPKLSGNLYGHLGHFKQDKFIQQGHNDSGKVPMVPEVTVIFKKPMDIKGQDLMSEKLNDRVRVRRKEAIDMGMVDSLNTDYRQMKKRANTRKKVESED